VLGVLLLLAAPAFARAQLAAALYPAGYLRAAWHLLLPVLLAGIFVVLYRRRQRDLQVQP